MFKKTIYSILFSSMTLLALETGDSLSQNIQDNLKLEADKVYVIDFFASWCKSCKKELPLIANIYNNKTVEVIGINVDKNKEDGEKLVKELELTFPVVYDTDKSLVEAFDPLGFPAVFIVKNSKIIATVIGAKDDIDSYIIEGLKDLK